MPRWKQADLPDVVKAAARVRAAIEEAVTTFARKHRYSLGAELRSSAEQICLHLHLAWMHPKRRITETQLASDDLDRLNLRLQLAEDVQAFKSFRQYEALGRLVDDLGRQCGGWLKSVRQQGQNVPGSVRSQRAPTLSTRAASQGANP